MEYINEGMRKGIKNMCIVAQTAQYISLMPKPIDFVNKIVEDVIYLSAEIQKLSENINKLLDDYASIPAQYIMSNINSMLDSSARILDTVTSYTDEIGELALNTMQASADMASGLIDVVGETTKSVISLGSTVAHSSTAALGDKETASDIYDCAETILEWTGEGFDSVKSTTIDSINNTIDDVANGFGRINDVKDKALDDAHMWLEKTISYLREQMDIFSDKIDKDFSDVTGISSMSNNTTRLSDALIESGSNSRAAQATIAVADSVSNVLKNFSISKVIKAFGGVLAQAAIVQLGLDKLPPIDFESMLTQIRGKMNIPNEELLRELDLINEETYSDIIAFGESMSKQKTDNVVPDDAVSYDDESYKELVKKFNDDILEQRKNITSSISKLNTAIENKELSDSQKIASQTMLRRELKSAIKEARKLQRQAHKAKQTDKFKDIVKRELDNLINDINSKFDKIKSDWYSMTDQYKHSIDEIKAFFSGKLSYGDMFIDDCCASINNSCDNIKEMCKNLTTQLIGCMIKVSMPADIGMVFPNPVYKIADFWEDVKTIVKFIRDLLTEVMNIINNVNKLARIMLNGFNSLVDIVKQLMELLGLKWFMDLIQNIIDFFYGKMLEGRALLENMLSPVYFKDTDEYENIMEMYEEELTKNDNDNIDDIKDIENFTKDKNGKNISLSSYLKDIIDGYNKYVKKKDEIKTSGEDDEEFGLGDLIENAGDVIVAYKNPILSSSINEESKTSVSDITDNGKSVDADVDIIGWNYFHPNLLHIVDDQSKSKLWHRIKSKIISKASKKSNRSNGGINKLNNRKIKITKDKDYNTAYKAFYWYTIYTDDFTSEKFDRRMDDGMIKYDSVVNSQNGSIIELEDGRKVFVANSNVRSGDYVTVGSDRYRVK